MLLMNHLPYGQTTTLFSPWNYYARSHINEWSKPHEMAFNQISIIIPVWNAMEYTTQCLTSIFENSRFQSEIIVVDNGSHDGTSQWLKSLGTKVRVHSNLKNLGFAKACNQGAKVATNNILVFLNNDTVVTPGWDYLLLRPFLSSPHPGLIGPRACNVSGPQNVQASYKNLSELNEFSLKWTHEHFGLWQPIPRLVGFCLATHKKDFWAVDGFSEEYEIGNYEDDDLCAKYRANGKELLVLHDTYIHHFGQRTFLSNDIDYTASMNKNRKIFEKKWARNG